jgi:hypothetical protein
MSTARVTAGGRAYVLADGNEIPMLGLGVWQVSNGPECVNAVRWALETGYRHIDTAQAYGNEESVGRGFRDSGVPREEVFITTKFYPARKNPVTAAERSPGDRPHRPLSAISAESGDIPQHWGRQVICHLIASHSSGEVPERPAPHHRRQ